MGPALNALFAVHCEQSANSIRIISARKADKNETKVINGVKYKPIKESKKHPLKENYDRIFRSRK